MKEVLRLMFRWIPYFRNGSEESSKGVQAFEECLRHMVSADNKIQAEEAKNMRKLQELIDKNVGLRKEQRRALAIQEKIKDHLCIDINNDGGITSDEVIVSLMDAMAPSGAPIEEEKERLNEPAGS